MAALPRKGVCKSPGGLSGSWLALGSSCTVPTRWQNNLEGRLGVQAEHGVKAQPRVLSTQTLEVFRKREKRKEESFLPEPHPARPQPHPPSDHMSTALRGLAGLWDPSQLLVKSHGQLTRASLCSLGLPLIRDFLLHACFLCSAIQGLCLCGSMGLHLNVSLGLCLSVCLSLFPWPLFSLHCSLSLSPLPLHLFSSHFLSLCLFLSTHLIFPLSFYTSLLHCLWLPL